MKIVPDLEYVPTMHQLNRKIFLPETIIQDDDQRRISGKKCINRQKNKYKKYKTHIIVIPINVLLHAESNNNEQINIAMKH